MPKGAVRTPRQVIAAVKEDKKPFTVVTLLDVTSDPKLSVSIWMVVVM